MASFPIEPKLAVAHDGTTLVRLTFVFTTDEIAEFDLQRRRYNSGLDFEIYPDLVDHINAQLQLAAANRVVQIAHANDKAVRDHGPCEPYI